MATILIQATSTSPEVTAEDIQAIETYSELCHWQDVVKQCASQLGDEACAAAVTEVDKAQTRLTMDDFNYAGSHHHY